MWELLDAENNTSLWLTGSKARVPTAAVSGLYFAHPQARYFAVGTINKDHAEDHARRKGPSVPERKRWLGPNLAYAPERPAAKVPLSARPSAASWRHSP